MKLLQDTPRKVLVLFLFFSFPLVSCTTSYYNIGEEGMSAWGGGFIDTKLDDGFYQIIAKSQLRPWTDFGTAREIFKKRATELCGEEGYQIVETTDSTYEQEEPVFEPDSIITILRAEPVISQIEGAILCKNSPLTLGEAKKQIEID